MKKNFTFLLLSLFSVSVVSAQRLLTEDFNYSAGSLTANSSGKWIRFAGNTAPIQVQDGSLTYEGYDSISSGGRVVLDSIPSHGESDFIRFTKQKSGTIYCSFLLNVLAESNLFGGNSATGEFFLALLPNQLNDPAYAAVEIRRGKKAGLFSLGITSRVTAGTPATVAWATGTYSTLNTYLVTVGYQVVPGDNNNIVSLWVNPSTNSAQPPPDATTTDSDTGNDTLTIGKVGFFQNSSRSPKCLIDALKVSTSWDDLILPLNLLSFNVLDNNGFASLSWKTCNEVNVKSFEVQKSSDARNFVAIGNIAAKNGSCGTTYSYRDAKELIGTAFYRLRMIDNDGKASYSAILSVNGKLPTKVSVFPNPVVNNLVLSHPKAVDGAIIKIVSLNGSVLATHSVQKDAIQTSVDVSKLAKGNYIVIFNNAQQQQTIKILKQ